MRIILPVLLSICFCSCTDRSTTAKLRAENDSLRNELSQVYKPGFGEFMSSIQQHHAKLWFAGINRNWELADFEMHEIGEALDNISKYEQDRKETCSIGTLQPALDSMEALIAKKDESRFRPAFELLTASCNHCHQQNNFAFNRVIIPLTVPVPNQDFSPALKELPLPHAK